MSEATARPPTKPSLIGTLLLLIPMIGWVMAFTPDPWAASTVPGFICFLALVERAPSTRNAMKWIIVFGAITIGIGYNWMATTVQTFGGLPLSVGMLAAAAFGVVSTVHALLFIPAYRALLSRGRRPHPLTTAVLFVACEALPIRLFAWAVGHGAINVPPVVQQAEWGGEPAMSLVFLMLIVPIHEWLRWGFAKTGAPARPKAALATFALGLACFGWGLWRYQDVLAEERDAQETIVIGIVQSNVGSMRSSEHDPTVTRADLIQRYERASRKAAADGAELILWPETSITNPIPFWKGAQSWRHVDQYLASRSPRRDPRTGAPLKGYSFLRDIGQDDVAFLIGCYEEHRPKRTNTLDPGQVMKRGDERFTPRYNVAALRNPGGMDAEWSVVRKVYLIPFGEDVPFDFLRDYLPQQFRMMAGEHGQPPLTYREKTVVPFLCYEGILPDYVLEATGGRRADLLVSLTNDSWFGPTWEPYQHLALTRVRAVEHRAPLVRATNTGISALVNPAGDVVASTELGFDEKGPNGFKAEPDLLVEPVPFVPRDRTIYARFGHRLPWVLYAWSLLALLTTALRPPPVTAPD